MKFDTPLPFKELRRQIEKLLSKHSHIDTIRLALLDLMLQNSKAYAKAISDLKPGDKMLVLSINSEKQYELFTSFSEIQTNDVKVMKTTLRSELERIDNKRTLAEEMFNKAALNSFLDNNRKMFDEIEQAKADAKIEDRKLLAEEIAKQLANNKRGFQSLVGKIHFEDFGDAEFERLCFAFMLRLFPESKISWLGETGSDGGRDIWIETEEGTICIQCANHRILKTSKVTDDITKLIDGNSLPDKFIVIAGGRISVPGRSSIKAFGREAGIKDIEIWTGAEFEEQLRIRATDLLERFTQGDPFPELN